MAEMVCNFDLPNRRKIEKETRRQDLFALARQFPEIKLEKSV
jgi:hypothetical protein